MYTKTAYNAVISQCNLKVIAIPCRTCGQRQYCGHLL